MIGRTIGHYQVLEKLGEGGMGVVYTARDTHLDRFVAIKVLPPDKVADPERRRRFVQEAKAASALNHPNIITIHDIAHQDGLDFIVMEYVAGKTLSQLIGRKGLKLNETLKCAIQIADGLAKAHAVGIVHRDLKPGNVMVTGDGLVKVLDFGLAKLSEPLSGEEAPTQTAEGTIVGTVAYMSPEQAQGKPVDARCDIFSFGSMLYEMVTGRQAFHGDTKISTLAAVINKEPEPLSAEVPHDLEKLITRCLRKQPERRFQHMADVKVALEELKEESDSGRLASGADLQPADPRRRWVLLAVGLTAAVALAATLWLWPGRTSTPPTQAPLVPVPLTSYPGSESHPSFSPDGSQVAFAWNGEARDNWDIYVKMIGTEKPLRLTSDPAWEAYPVWSPDGRWIAFVRLLDAKKLGYYLIPPIGGPARKLAEVTLDPSGDLEGPYHCWSPDGKWLVTVERDSPKESYGLFALSVDAGERRRLTLPEARLTGDSTPAISPDGRTLIYSRISAAGVADLYSLALSDDLKPQGRPRKLTAGPGMHLSPAWTVDGKEIVYSTGPEPGRTLWRLSASGAGSPQPLAFAGQDADYPAISRKGDRLVFVRVLRDVNIWRLDVPETDRQTSATAKFIASTREDRVPQYSPDGRRIAFQSDRSGSPEIWVCQSDGSSPVCLTSFRGPVTGQPRWSPDGRRIAFFSAAAGSRDIYVIDSEGGPPRQLTKDPADEAVPSWSRDGQWVYFHARRTAEIQIWKVPASGGEAVQVTRNGGSQGWESADGRALFFKKGDSLRTVPLVKGMPAGSETQVLDSVDRANYQVAEAGIYFIATPDATGAYAVRFYDFAARGIRTIATIRQPVAWGFAVSPDRRTILYAQQDEAGADLMLVEHFR